MKDEQRKARVKKILVTGAGGLVGYNVAKLLAGDSEYQTIATIHKRNVDELENTIQTDLQNDIEILKIDFDCIVHCAAQIPNYAFSDEQAAVINRCIDNNIIQYCINHNCRLIYISGTSVYGFDNQEMLREDTKICAEKYSSKYIYEKRNSEIIIENKCSDYCILRVSSPYGPQQRNDTVFKKFISAAFKGEKIYYFGTGERTQNFIDARDVARAVEKCIDCSNGVFNIAAPYSVSMKQLAQLVQKVGKKELNMASEVCNRNVVDPQEGIRINIDISLAEKAIGWKPQIELADGIQYWLRTMKEGENYAKGL